MIRIGRRQIWWLIALTTLLIVGGLEVTDQLRPLENAATDTRARLLRREVSSNVVVVGIDAASLKELESWPWSREHHANLIRQLSLATPRRVFLDIDFSSPSTDNAD